MGTRGLLLAALAGLLAGSPAAPAQEEPPPAAPAPPPEEPTPEDLRRRRDEATRAALARIRQGLPAAWVVTEGKSVVAVSHADPRFTRELVDHADALRAWLESELGFVGNGPVGQAILRICADRPEYEAIVKNRQWSPEAIDIVTYRDREGRDTWHLDGINRELFRIWLRDKHDRLQWALPAWLGEGLAGVIERARLKGGRMAFESHTWNSVEMMNLRRANGLLRAREIVSLQRDARRAAKAADTQTQFFVGFLVSGGASRSAKYRTLLADYIKNTIFLLDEDDDPTPQTWAPRERQILDALAEKTFPGWTDRDWEAFDALYRQELK